MSAWYTSWLPSIPTINVPIPSNIQGRFVSFVLKRLLGHLFKPDQLDLNQIDSQIGSGFVQVKDLRLDNEAISEFLTDLPIKLHTGSISSVTVRVPWSNPLTSTVRFSLHSLHLVFHLSPAAVTPRSRLNPNLTGSVASIADSFLHDELSPREEATLRESFYVDKSSSSSANTGNGSDIPGSIDPFLSGEDELHSNADPAGVSMFASLIERFLSRFEFEAIDTKLTLVHPERSSFTISIPEIHYGKHTDENSAPDSEGPLSGPFGTISISELTMTARNLRSHNRLQSPPTPSTISPMSSLTTRHASSPPHQPPTSSSSSSSINEESQFIMSQSLASLPPRPLSPASQVASSFYQSAVSNAPFAAEASRSNIPAPSDPDKDEAILRDDNSPGPSFHPSLETQRPIVPSEAADSLILSLGAEPVTIHLTTPTDLSETPSESHGSLPRSNSPHVQEEGKLRISLTTGVLSCAFHAWHVRSLLDIVDVFSSHHPSHGKSISVPSTPDSAGGPSDSSNSVLAPGIEGIGNVRGIVLVLLSPNEDDHAHEGSTFSSNDALATFFARPLVPQRLNRGYVRTHLENLSMSFSRDTSASVRPLKRQVQPARTKSRSRQTTMPVTTTVTRSTVSLSVSGISILAIHATADPASESTTLYASPILITDPHLPSQYPADHVYPDSGTFGVEETRSHPYPQLPTFDVIDWTDEKHRRNGVKLSTWRSRTRVKHGGRAARSSWDGRVRDRVGGESPARSPLEQAKQMVPPTAKLPAILLSTETTISLITGGKPDHKSTQLVELKTVPLHVFVDLGMALGSDGFLSFVDQIIEPGEKTILAEELGSSCESSAESSEDESQSQPALPGIMDQSQRQKERRRLERLVLKDLDLDLDYRTSDPTKKSSNLKRRRTSPREAASSVSIKLPMVRIQIRAPPPPGHARRSGALILDLHDVVLSTGSTTNKKPTVSFAAADGPPSSTKLVSTECRRIVLGCSPFDKGEANAFVSIGPLSASQDSSGMMQSQSGPSGDAVSEPLRPRIAVTQSDCSDRAQASEPMTPSPPTLTVNVDIPSLHIQLSKAVFDDLQYWVDDASQLSERTFGNGGAEVDSRDTSLIGSRFFARSKRSDSEGGSRQNSYQQPGSRMVVKVAVSEASIRLMLLSSRENGSVIVKPFDVFASDLDASVDLKPGKEETTLTLNVMTLNVVNTADRGSMTSILSLTAAQSLSSSPRPILTVRLTWLIVPETTAKESRIKVTLRGFTFNVPTNISLATDMALFFDSPPGTFESVPPTERTCVLLKIANGSVRISAPSHPGSGILYIGELEFATDLVGDSPEKSFRLSAPAASILFLDDLASAIVPVGTQTASSIPEGVAYWKVRGYALLCDIADLVMDFKAIDGTENPNTRVTIDRIGVRLHLCADTLSAVILFVGDLVTALSPPQSDQSWIVRNRPTVIKEQANPQRGVMASIDEHAFRVVPEVGTADLIDDDLPTNLDYLDESFGAAAGLRELRDDDLDEFDVEEAATNRTTSSLDQQQTGIISRIGGETIKMLVPEGIHIVENHFDSLPPDSSSGNQQLGMTTFATRIHNCDVTLFLYDGYDWAKTRKTIEDEVKDMRKRLARIKQLVATGQAYDPSMEDTSALLFNSVYIGLEHDVDDLDSNALIAAIDEELNEELETTSQSSWQSLKPRPGDKPKARPVGIHGKRLTRSRGPSMEFRAIGADAEVDTYQPTETFLSRTLVTIRDLEILDHIKTSTWQKFLTELRTDSRNNVRETDSNMVRVELLKVRPVPGHPSEEARLRAKILPLRLFVDQDALDFLKKFFSFQDPHAQPAPSKEPSGGDIYFQLAEIFPVDLKLDYKPRRVDYRALREGRTIELMNFFHFDGAEMTLRHITLSGITGWPKVFEMLNDLWTPDVKATQLMEVISGVSPIRSVVNVGSGFADLVLLPIAQYKKDGRIVRGVQKGTKAFVKSTATEAVKLGARLATGTQVILEQAEGVLGGQFQHPITTEALQVPLSAGENTPFGDEEETVDLISRYAEQPSDIREGVQTAYRSLQRNFNSAAQTILAVPMEVYEKSGSEGPVRAVIRAVPIAVLKPMIGVSEAVGKTLLGFHNSLDPDVRHETEAKYKHRH